MNRRSVMMPVLVLMRRTGFELRSGVAWKLKLPPEEPLPVGNVPVNSPSR